MIDDRISSALGTRADAVVVANITHLVVVCSIRRAFSCWYFTTKKKKKEEEEEEE